MMDSRNEADREMQRNAFFTRIVHEHARLLYRVAFSVLRNPEDAEDAVAEAMLKLLRGEAWQKITNEKAFLARTVWRVALDRRAAATQVSTGEDDFSFLEDRGPSPEKAAADLDTHRVLYGCINRLSAELREPLLLSAIEELNSREIGELMGLPEGTVRTRLMRARAELRRMYDLEHRNRGREVAAGRD